MPLRDTHINSEDKNKDYSTFDANKYNDWDGCVTALRYHKIFNDYEPRHKELFEYYYSSDTEKEEFRKEYIHPEMYWARKKRSFDYIIEEPIWEVYQFPLFTKKLCNMIIEEGEHFGNFLGQYEGVNKGKPYTTTDLILDCIPGIYNPYDTPIGSFYRDIKKIYLRPILKSVWNFIPKDWDKSWIARYRRNEQDYLKFHTDASTCASIISLNDDYEGGGTIFKRQKKRIDREAGWCTIHPSQLTHRHAGGLITKGKRYILVTFIS